MEETDQKRLLAVHVDDGVGDDSMDEDSWDDAKDEPCDVSYKEESKGSALDASISNQPSSSSAYSSLRSADTSTTNTQANGDQDLDLHKAVFNNNLEKVQSLLKKVSLENKDQSLKLFVNKKDKHGNTALHLACMLGRPKEMVSLLLEHGAAVDAKNLQRWTPFHEACSYGNREIILMMTQRLKEDVYDTISKNKLSETLAKTRNHRLVLKWEFQSWVPFITRVLPSDVCTINKQGRYMRIDTRLLDFDSLPWKRGDSSLIYSPKFEKKWIVLNHKAKKYQHFEPQKLDQTKDIDDKVDEFMAVDIMDFDLKSDDIQLTRSTCGWIWKADKVEKVNRFNADLYNFNNVYLITRKRREHLTNEDLKRNRLAYKAAVHVLKFGQKPSGRELEDASLADDKLTDDNNSDNQSQDGQDNGSDPDRMHRESLPPPPPTNVTWDEYMNADPPGNFPTLGREQVCKIVKRAFKASVAMSKEFPITKDEFLDLLSVIPLKHFKKLKEFIEGRLPSGFPVRVDVPIFPFLTARITFEDFAFIDGPIDESLFSVPSDYEEDPNLVQRLTGKLKNAADS